MQSNASSIQQPNTFAVVQDHQNFVWTAGHNGLTRHDSYKNINFSSNNQSWPLPFDWIRSISVLKDKKLLLATEGYKLWQFDTTTGNASPVKIDVHQQSVFHAVEYQNSYFLNVPNKLYQLNLKNNQTSVIAENIEISDLKVTKKHLYISTKNGLFLLANNKLKKLLSENIFSMSVSNETLIVATKKEIIFIDDNEIGRAHV